MTIEIPFTTTATPRVTYRQRVNNIGPLGKMTERIDDKIRRLRNAQAKEPVTEADILEKLQPSLEKGGVLLGDTDPFVDDITWNDYYRLMGRLAFATELVLAPTLFSSNDFEQRAALANGTSGKAVDIVDDALSELAKHPHDPRASVELRGVINEYTPIALINRQQDGISLMLPSSLYKDIMCKTDQTYYSSDDFDKHFRTNIQTKSRYYAHAPKDPSVAYIYADDYYNVDSLNSFPMSSLLRHENNGEQMSVGEDAMIAFASTALEYIIRKQRTPRNTTYTEVKEVEVAQSDHTL